MRLSRQITQFGHVVSALGGEARQTFAKDALNVRLDGFKLAPRFGYVNVAAKPGLSSDTFECFGLGIVTNTSGTSEGLSIENRAGICNLYSVNLSTFTRTSVGSLNPPASRASVVGYNDLAYIIFPGQTKSVWKHTIGDNASLSVVADTAYTPPSESATLTASVQAFSTRWTVKPADTITITSTDGITGSSTSTTNGIITVSGTDDDNGVQHRTLVQIDFGASENWSSRGYVGVECVASTIFYNWEITNVTPQVKTGGTWRDCEFKEFLSTDATKVLIVARVKGVTGISAVDGIRFTIGGSVNRVGSAEAFTVNPLKVGGQYLEAPLSTDRLWDYADTGTGINYAARFKHSSGSPAPSAVSQKSITASGAQGSSIAEYDTRLGGRTSLSVAAANTGTYDQVQFLRLMEDGVTWKQLAVVANTAGTSPSTIDTYEENELSALTTVTLTGVDPVDPEPPFSTLDIVGAFPYKESMVWLKNTGISNIQISRMGDPEELYDVAAAGSYDDTDLTNPAQRTMADNAADVPVWGSQIGQIAIVLGSKSAYSFSGDFPEQTTPCREIPGSRGVAGMYAACRYRPKQGQYAVAYADDDLNIWSVGGTPRFSDDASVRPFELSEPVRRKLKAFLLNEQRAEFPTLTSADTILEFDDVTSSVWVILGRRAAILRQGTGNDGWDLHKYQMTVPPGSSTVSACTAFYSGSATASSAGSGDVAWTSTGFAFADDDSYCETGSLGFGTSRTSEILRSTSFTPSVPLPVSATVTSTKFKIQRSKTGDLAVTETTVQPRKSGANLGSNLSTSYALTTSDVSTEFSLVSLPTIAEINAGNMGIDLKYTQETWLSAWNTLSNWTIVVSPTSPNDYDYTTATSASHTTAFTVTYTWIGGGTAPTEVWASFTGETSLSCVSPVSGTGSTDNGLGDVSTGTIANVPAIPPADPVVSSLATSGTHTERLTLTAGVATKTITMVSTSSVPPAKMRASHELTASIYTPTPAVVKVDSVEMQNCYEVTYASGAVTTGVSVQRAKFVDGLNLAVRNSGQMDVIERYDGEDIEGTGRDGGYEMPDAYFETQDMSFEGAYAQVAQVQVHTESLSDVVDVSFKSDETPYTSGVDIVKARWKRFNLDMKGIRFNCKLTFGEDAENISGLTIEYNKKSRGIN